MKTPQAMLLVLLTMAAISVVGAGTAGPVKVEIVAVAVMPD